MGEHVKRVMRPIHEQTEVIFRPRVCDTVVSDERRPLLSQLGALLTIETMVY